MNERIKELAEEAGLNMWVNGNNEVEFSENEKKFAELIVKECANFVDYRLTNPNGASIAWCDGSDIKEHFGVE
jgi:hypothetical protein